ncbi:hypothetical protein C8039_05410 [Halogeometricum sp. wsp3]|nr:hypothetical protein C8039_05410 [Halogeometricum sp. wsp3]
MATLDGPSGRAFACVGCRRRRGHLVRFLRSARTRSTRTRDLSTRSVVVGAVAFPLPGGDGGRWPSAREPRPPAGRPGRACAAASADRDCDFSFRLLTPEYYGTALRGQTFVHLPAFVLAGLGIASVAYRRSPSPDGGLGSPKAHSRRLAQF